MELVCEAAGGELAGLAEEAFLAGTVSLLDVVLLKSPAEIVAMISAGEATRDCVVREAGPLARALALARAIEESRFEAAGEIAAALGLSPVALLGCQLSAMRWLCQVKEQSYL
jgi:EAL and modified HD-GYP domain-containing signal transduction protein